MKIYFVVPDYFERRPKPCMNGLGSVFLTVAPDGTALPCHAARMLPGLEFPNVRDASVESIWFDSPGFNHFRGDAWMKEPCRSCPEKTKDFGGCRCQAYLLTGDAANADPVCDLSPHHHLVTEAVARAGRLCRRETAASSAITAVRIAVSMNRPALAFRAEHLTKRYGDLLAVDGIDLAIQCGRFFGLLGPNGAGKTSTIHMLSTLIRPTSGEAWVARSCSEHAQARSTPQHRRRVSGPGARSHALGCGKPALRGTPQ